MSYPVCVYIYIYIYIYIKRAGTLRCGGRPVVSAALPAVLSGEFQPAVDAEHREHRVHPPRCLSLSLQGSPPGFQAISKGCVCVYYWVCLFYYCRTYYRCVCVCVCFITAGPTPSPNNYSFSHQYFGLRSASVVKIQRRVGRQ